MTSKALTVIDAVIEQWAAAFDGTPEAQMDALDWLMNLRKKPTVTSTAVLIRIHALPQEQWAREMMNVRKRRELGERK